jgi:hypothetical protein
MSARGEGARPRAMKARDAARYIGCGRTKLKQLIASGAFPGAFRLGRDHVLPVADLDAFVDGQAAAARRARSKAPLVEPTPGVPPREADGQHPPALVSGQRHE